MKRREHLDPSDAAHAVVRRGVRRSCTPARWSTRCARREPDIDVFGLGGERFAAAGGRLVADFHGLSVTGLTEALSVLPRSFATCSSSSKAARDATARTRSCVIDYPDFNFRLMRAIKKLGIPVIYYISPQLWAWRAGPHQADEAQRRSRAADLSVRRGDLPDAQASTCASSAIR